MYRSQYDNDVTVWSPMGRLHQVEYAMEAVKQGSAVVGLKSATRVVLTAKMRAPSEISGYQKKIFKIDDTVGIGISGLTADARVLSRFLRTECLNHKYTYGSSIPVGRLVSTIAAKSQVNTQRAGYRPFGVGLLVAGYDRTGTHLYQTCPSGNIYSYKCIAIGARAQSAKTYLEKHFKELEDATEAQLIQHGLKALKDTIQEGELDTSNTSVMVLGKDRSFSFVEGDALQEHLDAVADYGSAPPPAGDSTSVLHDALMDER